MRTSNLILTSLLVLLPITGNAQAHISTGEQDWTFKISGDLSGGIAIFKKSPKDHYLKSLTDSDGNPQLNKDKKQIYAVTARDDAQTIGNGFTGMVHLIFVPTKIEKDRTNKITSIKIDKESNIRSLFGLASGYGITIGTGISSSTSGTFNQAPFIGASIFFGDRQEGAITLGCGWIPHKEYLGFVPGQHTIDANLTQEDRHSKTLFLGIFYKIGTGTSVEK